MLQDLIDQEIQDVFEDGDIVIEHFPNKTRLKQGSTGQCIKLPLCSLEAGDGRSILLNDDLSECTDPETWFDNTPEYSASVIKRILSSSVSAKRSGSAERKLVKDDISGFGELESSIVQILNGCSLMRYLCGKSLDTGYLTHFERLSVLYVFGHIGEAGKQFVHQVMSYTINYQYNITEKFIRKCPEKPISCIKLRDQYKRITAEIGCSCVFTRNQGCYPSPVMHAITDARNPVQGITLPISRTVTKERTEQMVQELNIHTKAQELVLKMIELRKQAKGIDNSMAQVEKKLEKLFDESGIDKLEVDMGILIRVPSDQGYEWTIQI